MGKKIFRKFNNAFEVSLWNQKYITHAMHKHDQVNATHLKAV